MKMRHDCAGDRTDTLSRDVTSGSRPRQTMLDGVHEADGGIEMRA